MWSDSKKIKRRKWAKNSQISKYDYYDYDLKDKLNLSTVTKWGATNRQVVGSIPDGVIGIFQWHNSAGLWSQLSL
jgi:hypothetical protein